MNTSTRASFLRLAVLAAMLACSSANAQQAASSAYLHNTAAARAPKPSKADFSPALDFHTPTEDFILIGTRLASDTSQDTLVRIAGVPHPVKATLHYDAATGRIHVSIKHVGASRVDALVQSFEHNMLGLAPSGCHRVDQAAALDGPPAHCHVAEIVHGQPFRVTFIASKPI